MPSIYRIYAMPFDVSITADATIFASMPSFYTFILTCRCTKFHRYAILMLSLAIDICLFDFADEIALFALISDYIVMLRLRDHYNALPYSVFIAASQYFFRRSPSS
jgi:hypothetical protein